MYEAYYFFSVQDAPDTASAAERVASTLSCTLKGWKEGPHIYGGQFAGFECAFHRNDLRGESGLDYQEYRHRLDFILPRPYEVYTPLLSAAVCIAVRHLFDGLNVAGMVTADWSRLSAKYESRRRKHTSEQELFDVLRHQFVSDVPGYATTLFKPPL